LPFFFSEDFYFIEKVGETNFFEINAV